MQIDKPHAKAEVELDLPSDVLGGSERQFRLLVQGVTDYAIYMLDPNGRIASWNAGGQRIKGYSSDEIIGQHFSRFYTDEDREAGEPAVALETARTQGRYEKEGWRVRRDGTRFWANVIIDPVFDDDGRLIGYAKVTRDITQRREQQRALEVAQHAMLQAHRMEAIGQLTYGVAHDFNNLLTVVTNSLDLIAADPSDPQRVRRLVAGAQRAAERGSLLTRQLLAYSRRQTLRPQVHDINGLIYTAESVLRRAVGEDVTIELNLGRGIGEVNIDGAEFEAALLNLVVNARDAMPDGGRITIRTREVHQREHEGRRDPGRYALVTVEDTGTGMAPEVVEHAMEPFFTTKEVGKGSGLGLSQVYGFAVQSGGDVAIESQPGEGTVISFYLPIRSDASLLGEGDSGAPTKVLLVEDDPDVQLMAIETLRHLGYAVLTADAAEPALDILRRDAEIEILFTDVVMPKGMSGVDLMHEARRLRPGIKVLLASGYARGQLPTLPEGVDFIAKPYRVDDVRDRLQALAAPRAAAENASA
ncbi:PAS domain-containing sensor histidine kinase [Lysobacter sp. N42]|nr:PAS domain-containing sensor histidine kinase [Lysobacter sp. N42]